LHNLQSTVHLGADFVMDSVRGSAYPVTARGKELR